MASYLFNQTIGGSDYADDYFLDRQGELEAVFADYKAKVHYWTVGGANDEVTVFEHDSQTLTAQEQTDIHTLLDGISAVQKLANQEAFHSQTAHNTLEIVAVADVEKSLSKQYRFVYIDASAAAIVTLNMLAGSELEVGEAWKFTIVAVFATGGGLHMQTALPDSFIPTGDQVFGINTSGTYILTVSKLTTGTVIEVAKIDQAAHVDVIMPEKYIKFDGVDSHFEVASADLTGDLANVLDLGQTWTITGILREEHLSANTVMFNRWSNAVGIGKYSGTNIFFHTINGSGGGFYFTAEQTTDLTDKRFFFINDGSTLTCYVDNVAAYANNHSATNSTSVNGQLIIGLRKHYVTILGPSAAGIDDVLIFSTALNSAQRLQVISSSDRTTLTNYNKVGAYWKMGEDTFPDIHDTKRNIDDTYINGLATDYKDV